MSLKPLDLQNLFVNLHQIAREQSARQVAPKHAQEVAADELKQKTLQADERVSASEDTGSGSEKIHDDQSQGGSQQEERDPSLDVDSNADDDGNTSDNQLFTDPNLGNKIDISG